MSLIFDPRTSALAAYMMNPLLYGDPGAAMAMFQVQQQHSPSTNLAQLRNSGSPTGKTHQQQFHAQSAHPPHHQAAEAAALAAAQQAAAMSFAANYAAAHQQTASLHSVSSALLSPNASKNAAMNSSSSSLTSNKSVKTGSSFNGPSVPSFRILDILESSSSSPNVFTDSFLQKMSTTVGAKGSGLGSKNVASPEGIKDAFTALLDHHRLEDDSVRGKKRPFASEGEEDCDDVNNGSSLSPRSGRSSPNGSLLSGATGNGMGGSGGKKARKARTIFTDKQLQELESMFDKHKYLSVQDRMDLAQRMGLTDTQVKTWYQNRRTKWKRQAAVGVDLLQEASNLAAVQNLIRTNPYWAQYMANPFFAQRLLPNMSGNLPNGILMPPGAVHPSLGPRANSSSSNNSASPSLTPNAVRVESLSNGEESPHISPSVLKSSMSEEQRQQFLMLAAAAAGQRQPKKVGEEEEDDVPSDGDHNLLFSSQQLLGRECAVNLLNGINKNILKQEQEEEVKKEDISSEISSKHCLESKPENKDEE